MFLVIMSAFWGVLLKMETQNLLIVRCAFGLMRS